LFADGPDFRAVGGELTAEEDVHQVDLKRCPEYTLWEKLIVNEKHR
jgi:hypothetical protein